MLTLGGVLALIVLLCVTIARQFNFGKKWGIFYKYFITNRGYTFLLQGMKNTAIIAVLGLSIGIVIGTLIAVVKVIPPYKRLTRYAQRVCGVYVAFFRGTPIVVQLLVGYYILLPLLSLKLSPVASCVIISVSTAARIFPRLCAAVFIRSIPVSWRRRAPSDCPFRWP